MTHTSSASKSAGSSLMAVVLVLAAASAAIIGGSMHMAADSPVLRKLASAAGVAVRHNRPNKDAALAALASERIAVYAERIVAQAPPLTQAQRSRIAAILRGATSDAA